MRFGSVIEKPSWVALHNLCAMLHPTVCVFWSCYLCLQAVWIHCCRCTLQAELCIFVMCEISIDFSLPVKTMKHNNKKTGLFCCHWIRVKPVLSLFFILFLYFTGKSRTQQALASDVICFHCSGCFFLIYYKDLKICISICQTYHRSRFRYENSWQISSSISNKSQQ